MIRLWIFLSLFSFSVSYGKVIRVMYYPFEDVTADMMFYFSHNGDENSAQSNPTLVLKPYTTTEIQIPDGVRYWYGNNGTGWRAGPASGSDNYDYDLNIYVGDYNNPNFTQHWFTAPSGGGASEGLTEPLQHLWAMGIAAFIVGAAWLGYRIYNR